MRVKFNTEIGKVTKKTTEEEVVFEGAEVTVEAEYTVEEFLEMMKVQAEAISAMLDVFGKVKEALSDDDADDDTSEFAPQKE